MKKINGLFPILLYQDEVLENQEIKNKTLSLIEKEVGKSDIRVPSEWETKILYTSYKQENSFLKKIFKSYYLKYIQNFFDQKYNIECKEIWFNYYRDGNSYQENHHHLNQTSPRNFSAVHFISYNPEVHSPICFYDPSRLIKMSSINEFYDQKICLNPTEGSLFMFPSYLEHSVPQSINTYDKPRITISFNMNVTS